jgi:hypothetical protein
MFHLTRGDNRMDQIEFEFGRVGLDQINLYVFLILY